MSGSNPDVLVAGDGITGASAPTDQDRTESVATHHNDRANRDDRDDGLLARIADGDAGAFGRLMDRHVDRAFRLARQILGSRADAEDAVQEAFLKVWRRAEAWRPGEARFSTWLWRVVVNQCLDARRRPGFDPLDAIPEPPDPAPDAVAVLARREDRERLEAAMAELPERQRAALGLVYGAGASNQEAADALGISVGALEQLLVRAKRSLRDRLKEEAGS
jgi:RNA polymerase sigma-70 factor, ECF subfamily